LFTRSNTLQIIDTAHVKYSKLHINIENKNKKDFIKHFAISTLCVFSFLSVEAADSFLKLCLNERSTVNNPPLSTGINKTKVPTYKEVGNNAYIIMTEHENPGYVLTFDVTNPDNPSRLSGNVTIDNGPNGVDTDGDFLYLSTNTGRIYAVDISDPTSLGPSLNITISTNDQLFDVAINPGVSRAYMAGTTTGNNASGLVIVNVNDPTSMTYQNNIDFAGGSVSTRGDYVYISEFSGNPSLRIYDISNDPDNPSLTSQLNLPGQPVQVELHPTLDVIYVADFNNSLLHTIDISDASNPAILNATNISGDRQPNFGSMRFIDNMMIVHSLDGIVDVYDVSNDGIPGSPLLTFDSGIDQTEHGEVSPNGLFYLTDREASPNKLHIYQLCLCTNVGLCINGIVSADQFIDNTSGPIN